MKIVKLTLSGSASTARTTVHARDICSAPKQLCRQYRRLAPCKTRFSRPRHVLRYELWFCKINWMIELNSTWVNFIFHDLKLHENVINLNIWQSRSWIYMTWEFIEIQTLQTVKSSKQHARLRMMDWRSTPGMIESTLRAGSDDEKISLRHWSTALHICSKHSYIISNWQYNGTLCSINCEMNYVDEW